MEEAKRQKDRFMAVLRAVKPACVTYVDIDDLCENGIAFKTDVVPAIASKFAAAKVDALFIPFCDFGEEQVAAEIARAFSLPTLIWGARDERPNTDERRGRDTQCGMFAATKVMRRFGVTYSYIYNCETESPAFREGFDRFLRVAAVIKEVRGLRVAKIGARPEPFMSVATNEAELMRRFGMVVVPISPAAIAKETQRLIKEKTPGLAVYLQDLRERMDCSAMDEKDVEKVAALKLATKAMMDKAGCTVAAMECWSAFYDLLGVPPCTVMGELMDEGFPVSCETDINGAITMAMLRGCTLGEAPGFLADLTIRHPENDNAELLWHCGPFPYSLKDEGSCARMVGGQERWELKQGDVTLCRFDDAEGNYYLFAGEGRTTTGPETNGTYLWLQVDNWKKWEERLIFGPYIHHVGGTYGKYLPVLKEAARYLNLVFEVPDGSGPCSL